MTPSVVELAGWIAGMRRLGLGDSAIAATVTSWRAGTVPWGMLPGSTGGEAMTYIGASETDTRSTGLFDYAPEVSQWTLQGLDIGQDDEGFDELGQYETVARIGRKVGGALRRIFKRRRKKKRPPTPARPPDMRLPVVPTGTAIGGAGLLIAGGIVLLALMSRRR